MRKQLIMGMILVMLLAVSFVSSSAEPKLQMGLKGGLNLANMSGDATKDRETSMKLGPTAGAFVNFTLNDYFDLQPEFIYTVKGLEWEFKEEDGTYTNTEEVTLSYFEIPVLIRFKIPLESKVRPSLFAGPTAAFNLSARSEGNWSSAGASGSWDADITNARSPDYGVVFGGAVTFPVGSTEAGFEVRYSRGLEKAFDDVDKTNTKSSGDGFPFADAQGRGEKMRHVVISIMVIALLPFQFM
jgi:hypothetical protein